MKDKKLSFREKLAFGMGDAGCNFIWTTVSSFLTLYYTDSVGISAAVAGTIMLVTRLLDGITDLVFGTILDRTQTRWGKARPWILWSTPMMAVGIIALFNVPDKLGANGKIVYAVITYVFVAAIAYTACNLSYNALLSLMTNDQQSRTSASTIRFICTMVTAVVINSITMGIVNVLGWGVTSVIYAVLGSCCLLITFFGTVERVQPTTGTNSQPAENISVAEGFMLLFKNRYFYSIAMLFVFVYIGNGLTSGVGIYFARDVMGNENYFGLFSLATMIPMIASLLAFPILAKKFGKWKIMMVGTALGIVGCLVVLLSPTSLYVVLGGLALKGLGSGPSIAGLFALVGDGVIYGEWKTGVRQDGLFNSATSFGMKVGTGLGTALVGWGLELGKYQASLAVQTASTQSAITILYAVIPLVCSVLALISLGLSNIDKIYPDMEKDLQAKNSQ